MAVSKVILNGVTEINLTADTAIANDVAQGKTFHLANGTQATGTATGGGGTYQSKSVTPTESAQTVTPDSGYDALSSVEVVAISSTYVGTGITRRSSSDLTVSGNTVTAPTGYYASSASKSVASGSATTPATTITANPTISVSDSGLITASVSGSQSITPTVSAGYVASGTAGTVSVSGSNTSQLSTQAAQTITPGTTNQTIASGKYLTGTQTILGDSNLVAANIAAGVSIFGVDGVHQGVGTYQTKTVTPTESSQTVSPDSGYDALSSVTVNAISSTYIGSEIDRMSSSDLTASGATVTAPAGYYAENASKSISSGSAVTPTTTISVTPSIIVSSSGLITAAASGSQSIIPTVSAGYVSNGTAGTVSVSGSNTSQLTTQAAQTITPTTTDQTISSGLYLTGTQTILGDANLIAANIAKNISIFGVLGTFEGGSSIEMESGTFKPSSDIAHPTISFSNTHTTPPSFAWIAYNGFVNASSMMVFLLFDPVALFGFPMYYSSTSTRKGAYFMGYRGTGTAASFSSGVITYGTDNSGSSDTTYYRYYATESQFKPYSGSGQRYFRSSNTFSWKAYWF